MGPENGGFFKVIQLEAVGIQGSEDENMQFSGMTNVAGGDVVAGEAFEDPSLGHKSEFKSIGWPEVESEHLAPAREAFDNVPVRMFPAPQPMDEGIEEIKEVVKPVGPQASDGPIIVEGIVESVKVTESPITRILQGAVNRIRRFLLI